MSTFRHRQNLRCAQIHMSKDSELWWWEIGLLSLSAHIGSKELLPFNRKLQRHCTSHLK